MSRFQDQLASCITRGELILKHEIKFTENKTRDVYLPLEHIFNKYNINALMTIMTGYRHDTDMQI